MTCKKITIGFALFVMVQFWANLYCNDIHLNLTASSADREIQSRRKFIFVKDFEISNHLEIFDHGVDKAKKVKSIIISDLQLEPSFKVENSSRIINNTDYNSWALKNVDYSIDGKFDNKTNILKIKLLYVPNKEKMFEKNFTLSDDNLKLVAHKITDEILFVINGNKGMNSTNIVFTYALKGSSKSSKNNVKEIYTIAFDGNDLTQITDNKSISILPTWNPRKRQVLYTTYKSGNPDLFLYDFEFKKTTVLADKQGLNMGAQYSPKGDEIAMARTVDGNLEIVLIDSDGKQLRRITQNKFIDFSPTWGNDSKNLAFISDRTGNTQIYVCNLESREIYPLTFDANLKDSLDWSPAKDELVFSSLADNVWDIYIIDFKTKQIQKLTENVGNNEDPSWSPDGQYVCFTSTRNGNKELFVMKKDGTNQRRVFAGNGTVYSPRWEPIYE